MRAMRRDRGADHWVVRVGRRALVGLGTAAVVVPVASASRAERLARAEGVTFAPGSSLALHAYRTLAVDRRLIRTGSRVYVPWYRRHHVASGWFVARDTGGAILGHHVDVYRPPTATPLDGGPVPEGPAHLRDPARALTAPTAFAVDDHCVVILPAGRQSLAAALSALLSVFVAGGPGAPVGAAPALVTDPPDVHGPLDILQVGLHQQSGVLALTVRLRGVPPVQAMGVPGRALCLRLAPASGGPAAGEVCLRVGPGLGLGYQAPSSTGAPRLLERITGRVLRPDRHTVVLRFHAADAGLHSGPFAWSVRTPRGVAAAPARRRQPARTDAWTSRPTTETSRVLCRQARWRAAPLPGPSSARAAHAEHEIALTFDDGPGPYSASVLSALERERVPATFFVVGEHVAAHEELLRRMVRDGDAIGDHSFSHRNLARDGGFAGLQIEETKRAIEHAADYVPCLFRAPYGRLARAAAAGTDGGHADRPVGRRSA